MNLSGAEIFSVGTWNGLTFDHADLDAIVEAFNQRGQAGRVPLKLGHNDVQPVTDGQPALGWIQRVWREGEKLLADFVHMPATVYDAIKAGLYKFVSVELLGEQADGRTSPWVLDAVALLGADIPAVGNLKDLQQLARMAKERGVPFRATFTHKLPEVSLTQRRPKGMTDQTKGGEGLEELRAAVADLSTKVATFSAENATLKATVESQKAEIDKRDAEAASAKVKAHRDTIKAKFEDAVKRQTLAPAARDLFYKMQGVDDDNRVTFCALETVDAYIALNEKKPDGRRSFSRGAGGDAGSDTSEKDADAAVASAIADELEKNENVTYRDAMIRVFRKDPELGRRYIFQRG